MHYIQEKAGILTIDFIKFCVPLDVSHKPESALILVEHYTTNLNTNTNRAFPPSVLMMTDCRWQVLFSTAEPQGWQYIG